MSPLLKVFLMTFTKCQKMGENFTYKNKAGDGGNNICEQRIKEIREKLPEKTSQRKLADMLQRAGLDIVKNSVQRIERGKRFVTDIEFRDIAKVLRVSYQDLLDY